MKKLFFLTVIFSALLGTTSHAQASAGPSAAAQEAKETDAAALLRQTKERVKPLMVQKTGLTEAQADKVIEILFEMRMAAGALRNLDEAERSQKLAELKATKDKKFSELLTVEQIQAVKAFYEELGRNAQQKG